MRRRSGVVNSREIDDRVIGPVDEIGESDGGGRQQRIDHLGVAVVRGLHRNDFGGQNSAGGGGGAPA